MNDKSHQWEIPPANLSLELNEVHIWITSLQPDTSSLDQYRALLSEDETKKAQRFYFDKDRNHYIVARGVLRSLLGNYMHCDPHTVSFTYNTYGKPFLASLSGQHNTHNLHFNVSHSSELALYAFAYDRRVGVDVEYMRSNIEYDDLARVSFSPTERTVLRSLNNEDKHKGFYNCWTRKEAFIKAIGKGLSHPLDSFDVSLRPSEPAKLLANRDPQEPRAEWSLLNLDVAPNYAGALVTEGHGWQPYYCRWSHAHR